MWFEDHEGTEDPVVLVHPKSGSSEIWAPQADAFSRAGHRLIVFDRRGSRRSVPTGTRESSGVNDLVDLLDHLKVEQAHLVGTALGGSDALGFAVAHPDRVKTLVLSNSFGGVSDIGYVKMFGRMWSSELLSLPAHLLELSPTYRGSDPGGVDRWKRIHHDAQAASTVDERLPDGVTLEQLERLCVPTLMITGAADLLTPPSLMRLMAERVSNCRFEVVPDAGHATAWEQPDTWNMLVLEFIRDN